MSTGSGIEWTDATWNPVVGCTRASAGCDNCYAVTMTHRLERMGQPKYAGLTVLNGRGDRHFNGVVRTVPEALAIPLSWKKPRRVFVNSMSDLFHKDVPDGFIDRVFAVMALCPRHTFQVLTKRPERMAEYFETWFNSDRLWRCVGEFVGDDAFRKPDSVLPHKGEEESEWWDEGGPLPNVWIGTSVEDQARVDERVPWLLKCPAAVRFLSVEPMLGAVDLEAWLTVDAPIGLKILSPFYLTTDGKFDPAGGGRKIQRLVKDPHDLHWVIVGGESGPGARPCDVAWVRSIVQQCKAAGVPCFVKQLGREPRAEIHKPGDSRFMDLNDPKGGDMAEWPEDLRVREMPKATVPA